MASRRFIGDCLGPISEEKGYKLGPAKVVAEHRIPGRRWVSRFRLPDGCRSHARGPLSAHVIQSLRTPVHRIERHPEVSGDPIDGDDFHLALYLCYELHYASIDGVDAEWEWDPSLLDFRRRLEDAFEKELTTQVPPSPPGDVAASLRSMAEGGGSPSLSRYLEADPVLDHFKELVIHRSAYQLKEADPHSWIIPRLAGRAKAALVEIQIDEYGSGDPDAMHAVLFADTMRALGLDARYGAYIHSLPGITLAAVNLVTMFGLHRRWRAAGVGHLALFEMSSTDPNRRYGNALRKLGYGREVTRFYDEHVVADAVHETIAAYDLAGSLAKDEPDLAVDIDFGARTLMHLEDLWSQGLIAAWDSGRSSLLQ